jgi:hypothetical protein
LAGVGLCFCPMKRLNAVGFGAEKLVGIFRL